VGVLPRTNCGAVAKSAVLKDLGYTQSVTSNKRAAKRKVVRVMMPNVSTNGAGEEAK
jgi:hypothetical protein